jgi:hypothetical protein
MIHAGFAGGAAHVIADTNFVAAATGQAALIVLTAAISAEQATGTTRAVETG